MFVLFLCLLLLLLLIFFFNNKETKLFVTPLSRGSPGAAATSSLSFGFRVMEGCVSQGLGRLQVCAVLLRIGCSLALLPLQAPPGHTCLVSEEELAQPLK